MEKTMRRAYRVSCFLAGCFFVRVAPMDSSYYAYWAITMSTVFAIGLAITQTLAVGYLKSLRLPDRQVALLPVLKTPTRKMLK